MLKKYDTLILVAFFDYNQSCTNFFPENLPPTVRRFSEKKPSNMFLTNFSTHFGGPGKLIGEIKFFPLFWQVEKILILFLKFGVFLPCSIGCLEYV